MILVVRGCRLADYLRVASTTKGVGADVLGFIACSVFGISSDFVLSFCICMLMYVLFRSGGNSMRCNCFLASQPL